MKKNSAQNAAKKIKAPLEGIVHVRSTFNNTIVNITNTNGDVICWGTPGKNGYKGSRKSTPFAAQITAEAVAKTAFDAGMRKVEVHICGAGNGREGAVRAVAAAGLEVSAIKDFTGGPHNGCGPPKKRRV